MATMTPDQFVTAWANNLTQSIPRIKQGVNNVTESPTEKAARAVDSYVAGVQRAAQEQRYQEGLRAVSLEDWKRATGEKGTAAITNGVNFAKPKMLRFAAFIIPETQRIKQEIGQMPKGKGANNFERMRANFEKMSALRYRKR